MKNITSIIAKQFWSAAIALLAFVSCSKTDILESGPGRGLIDGTEVAGVLMAEYTPGDVSDWMSFLPDGVRLSTLTIPGTHDSGARHEPVSGTAKTQNLSIAAQLNAGVRFLDIRCRHYQDAFVIHHGSVYQHLNFDDVLHACKQFLQNHPRETIIMSVKQEYNAEGNTQSFAAEFDDYVAQDPALWHLSEGIPSLGNARGKIVLLRRFVTTDAWGIDASHSWGDQATFTINNGSYSLRIQDEYVVNNNTGKIEAVTDLLGEASADNGDQTLYVNFTSGYQKILWVIPNIPAVSDALNPWTNAYFVAAGKGGYGIVPMDFITPELAANIVQVNF